MGFFKKLLNFFSKDKEKVRMVKAENGIFVELAEDMPDAYANIIAECFKSGETIQGRVTEEGELKVFKR